jgi:curved DNA binding protein
MSGKTKASSSSSSAAASTSDETIADPNVFNYYKAAGDIASRVCQLVAAGCVAGANVTELSLMGDEAIVEQTNGTFKKNQITRGIAFPTCLSINHVVCHYSPLPSDEPVLLKDGDLVKIELGVHFDGHSVQIGQTVVVGASKDNQVTGRKADVIEAAYTAAQAAMRIIKAGNKTSDVVTETQKILDVYKCKFVEGFTSHQVTKDILDGEKTIFFNPIESQKKEYSVFEFAENEVYTIDILVSTGEGKTKRSELKTNVFKKTKDTYLLKMKTSRAVLSEVQNKFNMMAFNIRSLDDEKKTRMGLVECITHQLVIPYDILCEKEGELVALYKFTIALTSSGSVLLTNPPRVEHVKSEFKITDAGTKAILETSIKAKV